MMIKMLMTIKTVIRAVTIALGSLCAHLKLTFKI